MTFFTWLLLIYSSLSLLTLFNKGIRHLYISVIDSVFCRFYNYRKKHYKTKKRGFISLILGLLEDILELSIYFISAPLVIIYHFPNRYKYRFVHTPLWKIKPIKKEYLIPPLIIKIKKDTSFVPDAKQVIYFEDSFNEKLNKYISVNHEKIVTSFKKRGYHFIYLPKTIDKLGLDEVRYMNPAYKGGEAISINRENIHHEIINKLLSYIDSPISHSYTGGFLRCKEVKSDSYKFTYFSFTNLENNEIEEQIRTYLSSVGDSRFLYNLKIPERPKPGSENFADETFDIEIRKLIQEISDRVDILKQKGIDEMLLKTIFSFDSVELSRLLVTNDYKILLPDYNNLEITMYPLPKAVYILFLRYPEGISFKNLIEYRNELLEIYKSISGREDIEAMEKSVDNVVNSSLNSINENCSRIREAFIIHFDDAIAKNYYITGGRAKPKKITLDRKLLTIE